MMQAACYRRLGQNPREIQTSSGDHGGRFEGFEATMHSAGMTATFRGRFLDELGEQFAGRSEDGVRETCIPRREAARVLRGVHWRFIPSMTIERRQYVKVGTLAMLCCCLDDEEVGAAPGAVTPEQLLLAWTAAGHRPWLIAEVRKRMFTAALRRTIDTEDVEYRLRLKAGETL